jgi:3-oxoacyl-[acyl-carrier-protein] synthase-3
VSSSNTAYITSTGAFLPGHPISNDEIEEYLGLVNGKSSRYKNRVLASCGITSRHYALDKTGSVTHLNEELISEAIKLCIHNRGYTVADIDFINVGTTFPDLLAPGFASMVHGRLGGSPCEIASMAGICNAGTSAIISAYRSVLLGQRHVAIAAASERVSAILRGQRFQRESELLQYRDEANEGFQYFNADFLRWILSDGAGSFLIESKPNPSKGSLKIEWVEYLSYANQLPTCMYMGTDNPSLINKDNVFWAEPNLSSAEKKGLFLLRQDIKLLEQNICDIASKHLESTVKKYNLDIGSVDHFLFHFSSFFFKDKSVESFKSRHVLVPIDRWYTNLKDKGNTGSASIFIMLNDFLKEKKLKNGETVLLAIPESGRFSMAYILLTYVE